MKNKFFITGIAILSLSAVPLAFGQQDNQKDPKNVGQGTTEGAKSISHGTEKGAKKLGSETKQGASEFGKKAAETGSDIKDVHLISAGKDFGQGTGKLGAKTGKGIGG